MSSKPIVEADAIYSREEVAHILGISLTTLKQLIRAGHLVVSQPEGIRRVFIKGASILEMLDRTTCPPNAVSAQPLGSATLFNKPSVTTPKYPARPPRAAYLDRTSTALWQQEGRSNNLALRPKRESRATGARKRIPATRGGVTR